VKPLRVLYLINGFAVGGPVGGAERFTLSLARALDRNQVEPVLAGLWQWDSPFEADWLARLREEGLAAFAGAPKDDSAPLRNILDSIRILRAHLPAPVDIIHSQCDFGDLVALALRRRLGARALLRTAHNEREWAKRPWRRVVFTNGLYPFVYRAELGVSQKVVGNLDARPLARLLHRRGILAYNALDFGRFENRSAGERGEVRSGLGIPPDAFVAGTVGRLAPQKGLDVLLAAAQRVLAQRGDAWFVIVGSGELAGALRAQAGELGIAGRVVFTGARQDVERLLPAFDLFVSSSLWEGLPTAILEAMAARVPVVATRVSGTVELVEDGLTGLLAPPGDSDALAKTILAIMEQPDAAAAMAARARPLAASRFDISAIARQHEALYRNLMRAA
jgi:glycosyltransferase involved in cell wall biosynthesis